MKAAVCRQFGAPEAVRSGVPRPPAELGRYRSVRGRGYDLADVTAAHRFVDAGRKSGNVVLRMPASAAARMS